MGVFNWLRKTVFIPEKVMPMGASTRTGDDAPTQFAQLSHKRRGDALLGQGRLDDAAASYRQAIAANAHDADAHLNLGFVLSEQKRYQEAEQSLRQALKIDPALVDVFYILGVMCKVQGNSMGAIENFTQALALKPDFQIVYGDLCQLFLQNGRADRAKVTIVNAISFYPENADFHACLGNLHVAENETDQAIYCFQKALSINPDDALTHHSLGLALQTRGQLAAAADSYGRCIALQPDRAETPNNLGTVFQAQGKLAEAVEMYRKALLIKPNCVEVHINLGVALQEQGKGAEAINHYERALLLKPNSAEAHFGLGFSLRDRGDLFAAVESYRRALLGNGSYAEAYTNLGGALQAIGNLEGAIENYRKALELKPNLYPAHSNLLYAYCFYPECSPVQYLSEATDYGNKVMMSARSYVTWPNSREYSRRLRVGLISGDLRQHPVGNFLEGVLGALAVEAASRLEFFAYPSHVQVDEVTERIKAHCSGWRLAAGLSDEALAQCVRDDEIDILIDLSGHTEFNRLPLFAWKPAPVQITWLGYLATTGVSAIDYVIADAWTLPENEEANFAEKVWRLPESYLCFTPPADSTEVGPLPAIRNGHITFGSFNNLSKMNNSVVALWSRVLKAVPHSRLFLKSPQLTDASVRQSVVERFAVHGIDAERLMLEGPVLRSEYLTSFQRIDIALDPFPYPGITTSVEGLWMGVPLVTLAGKGFLARQGVGLLMNAGIPEWIASDPDDYVARAVAHAGDLASLSSLRTRLRQQVLSSPIFDARRFAHHFEVALRGMWQKWCVQQQAGAS